MQADIIVSMYIFYLIAMLMANGFQQRQAVIFLEHQTHIVHVRHVEHVNYEKYLTIQAQAKSAPIVQAPQPIPTPKTLPTQPVQPAPVQTTTAPGPLSYYSCSSLESLWVSAGGNPASEFIAAQIATAESGGNPYAISPTSDYGLWQINSSNAPGGEMLNPWANVKEAIALSSNGADWSPWTTYTSGIYASEC